MKFARLIAVGAASDADTASMPSVAPRTALRPTPVLASFAPGSDRLASPYDSLPEEYDEMVLRRTVADAEAIPAIMALLGDIRGLRALDLGCGAGHSTRVLAQAGATRVMGVDLSGRQIRAARAAEEAELLGVIYVQENAERGDLYLGEFDVVTSSLALSDIVNHEAAIQTAARHLAPGGHFVFVIIHPAAPYKTGDGGVAWPSEDYFQHVVFTTPDVRSIRHYVPTVHRPEQAYHDAAEAAGLRLRRRLELPAPADHVARAHAIARHPWLLALSFYKPRPEEG